MSRTKRIKVEKTVASNENTTRGLPIEVSLKLAGQDSIGTTDNVLRYLTDLKIDRLRIKSPAQFSFKYNGKYFMKSLTIPQLRRFIGNPTYKMIFTKWVNQNLGLNHPV